MVNLRVATVEIKDIDDAIDEYDAAVRFIQYHIVEHIVRNKRTLSGITYGDTGTGKSYFNLTTAYVFCRLLNKPFNVRKSVVWDATEYLARLKEANKYDVLLPEELGVMASNRTWYTAYNRFLSFANQTMRFKRLLVLSSVPNLSFVDNQVRAMISYTFETLNRDIQLWLMRNYGIAGVKPRQVYQNPRTGNVYYYAPRLRTPRGMYVLDKLYFVPPPDDIIEEYEDAKRRYFEQLMEKGIDTITEEEGDVFDYIERIWPKIEKNKHKLMGKRGAYDIYKIMALTKCDRQTAYLIKAKLELEA